MLWKYLECEKNILLVYLFWFWITMLEKYNQIKKGKKVHIFKVNVIKNSLLNCLKYANRYLSAMFKNILPTNNNLSKYRKNKEKNINSIFVYLDLRCFWINVS